MLICVRWSALWVVGFIRIRWVNSRALGFVRFIWDCWVRFGAPWGGGGGGGGRRRARPDSRRVHSGASLACMGSFGFIGFIRAPCGSLGNTLGVLGFFGTRSGCPRVHLGAP